MEQQFRPDGLKKKNAAFRTLTDAKGGCSPQNNGEVARIFPLTAIKLTFFLGYVRVNSMHANRLHNALDQLCAAIREAEAALEEVRAEPDPLALHIFISRRQYRNVRDTKSGKRSDTAARLSWQTACNLGFRGSLGEWARLMGATPRR